MWIIAKVKKKNFEIFKKELEEKLKSKVTFYFPKVLIKKKTLSGSIKTNIKNLLGTYIFCYLQNLETKNLHLVFGRFSDNVIWILVPCIYDNLAEFTALGRGGKSKK